ncbi:MAG: hypothetical protein WC901_02970 [Candidatus Margulisiibacteriota bacterium]
MPKHFFHAWGQRLVIAAMLIALPGLLLGFSLAPQNQANFVLTFDENAQSVPFEAGEYTLALSRASFTSGIYESLDLSFGGTKNNKQYMLCLTLLVTPDFNLDLPYDSKKNGGQPLVVKETATAINAKPDQHLLPSLTLNLAYAQGNIFHPDSIINFNQFTVYINSFNYKQHTLSLQATFEARTFDKKLNAYVYLDGAINIINRRMVLILVD